MGIEQFLGLSTEDIQRRMEDLERRIPTIPGTGYLETRLKQYKVQPWPFISYLAHWAPELLEEGLGCYKDYGGAENYHAILEGLREEYIMYKVLVKLKKAQEKTQNDLAPAGSLCSVFLNLGPA